MVLRNRKNIFIIVVFALLIATGLLFVLQRGLRGNQVATTPPPAPAISSQPPLTYAEKGQLTPGFPKELILDDKARLANSYSITYNQNLNQYTAAFDSAESMLALYATYNVYFKDNGWTIANQITKYPTSRGIYATKGNTEVSIAIMAAGKKSKALINYLVK